MNFTGLDFSFGNLYGAILIEADLSNTDLSHADLRWSRLDGAILKGAQLLHSNLAHASLKGNNLSGLSFDDSDLSGTDMTSADVSGSRFTGVKLIGIQSEKANYANIHILDSNLSGAFLGKSLMEGAHVVDSDLTDARLNGADLSNARLSSTNLSGANLGFANLTGTHWEDADLSKTKLNYANLSNAKFEKADLSNSNMERSNLYDARFAKTSMIKTDLHGADLRKAHLQLVDLSEAEMQYANLSDATLDRVNLTHANLRGASLERVVFEPASVPSPSNLVGVKGLSTLTYMSSRHGLAMLRKEFENAGMREEERKVTYSLKRRDRERDWNSESLGDRIEAAFNYVMFEITSDYGMAPGRPLRILGFVILTFSFPYMYAISSGRGIKMIWPKEMVSDHETFSLLGRSLDVRATLFFPGTRRKLSSSFARTFMDFAAIVLVAIYFSALSSFHIGWREFSFGTWLSRVQPREYSLVGTRWVRTLTGLQAVLSVYLLALWIVTYFSRPFE